MIKINLLPHKKIKPKEKGLVMLQAGIVGLTVVVVLGLGGWYYFLASKVSELDSKNQEVSAKLETLKKKVAEVENYKTTKLGNENKLNTIDEIGKSRVKMAVLLNEINRVMSKDVWLTSLSVTAGTFKVEGVGMDKSKIAAFSDGLKNSASFTGVELGDVAETPSGTPGVKTYSFSVKGAVAGYTPLKAPAAVAPGKPGAKPETKK